MFTTWVEDVDDNHQALRVQVPNVGFRAYTLPNTKLQNHPPKPSSCLSGPLDPSVI